MGSWRERFDQSAAAGVPAHVTLVYPFAPFDAVVAGMLDALREVFAPVEPFGFDLVTPARFPTVLYLVPKPGEPFRALIERLRRRFPEYPPYGGELEDVVPHLTVAESDDESLLARIEAELVPRLPIAGRVSEAVLMAEGDGGRWRVAVTFPFGGG